MRGDVRRGSGASLVSTFGPLSFPAKHLW